ncbi:MAG: relaxase/mobilization nuclease domain-containing protein [Desulfobacteraceae bacterium]|nr:relaxase/mobilization nuclease domain-containing protein [Desulfobacteraceae bacterium]MBC2756284.1 relaxase/mobilization nuclease domain-containing protein [Desulfobacteraceae bacterium]
MSRKSASFGQLIDYINAPEKKAAHPIFQNLESSRDDPKAILKEFLNNSRYCPLRKNSVKIYHEILSFSDVDKEKATPKIIQNMVIKWIELRAHGALAYAKIHFDTECPHAHIMISGNLKDSAKKLSLSRKEFNQLRINLETYQNEKYPELKTINYQEVRKKKKPKKTRSENELERRTRRQSQKQKIIKRVNKALINSYSKDQFLRALNNENLNLYQRGKTEGIQDRITGQKYRLKTLGIIDIIKEAEKRWEIALDRLQELEKIQADKGRQIWKEFGFRQEIFDIIDFQAILNPRQQALKQIQMDKFQSIRGHEI